MDKTTDDIIDSDSSSHNNNNNNSSDDESNSDNDNNNDTANKKIKSKNTKLVPKKDFTFTTNQRRQHFQLKIHYYEHKLKKLKIEKNKIDTRRIELSEVMKNSQSKQYLLKLEKDRFANYKEDIVTSSVIHGY